MRPWWTLVDSVGSADLYETLVKPCGTLTLTLVDPDETLVDLYETLVDLYETLVDPPPCNLCKS